mgnify:CR=1 FL=1
MKKLDLNKKEKSVEFSDPARATNLSSKSAFEQEKNFYLKAYKDSFFISNEFVNINYEDLHYGRVDNLAISIKPKKQFLTQVRKAENRVLALNFVTQAYEDFSLFWDLLKRRNALQEESSIYDLKLYHGFKDIDVAYQGLYETYYTKLETFIDSKNFDRSIVDFKSFLRVFIQFSNSIVPLLPVTKSYYNLSKFFDAKGNALILEFQENNKIEDKVIYKKWIKDSNFQIYKNSVEQFGFSIDKGLPWRIVANTSSIAMKRYMREVGISSANIYSTLYDKIHLEDIQALQEKITYLYNTYVTNRRLMVQTRSKICNQNLVMEKKRIFREPVADYSSLSKQSWIRLYVYFRAKEVNLDWDQAKFDLIVKNVTELEKGLDISAAMGYVEPYLNVRINSTRKNHTFNF